MKEEMSKRKFIYIKIMMLALVGLCFLMKPMTVNADGIPVSLGYVPFDYMQKCVKVQWRRSFLSENIHSEMVCAIFR